VHAASMMADDALAVDFGPRAISFGAVRDNDGPENPRVVSLVEDEGEWKNPLRYGLVEDWGAMDALWDKVLDETAVDKDSTIVAYTEPLHNPKAARERTAEMLFEKHSVHSILMAPRVTAGMCGLGTTNGLAIHMEEDETTIVPMYQGYVLRSRAMTRRAYSGDALVEYVQQVMREEKGVEVDLATSRGIAWHCAAVAPRWAFKDERYAEQVNALYRREDKAYELPDGSTLALGVERFKFAEMLFDPSLAGLDALGIGEDIDQVMMKCSWDWRTVLHRNMYMFGPVSEIPGIGDRVEHVVAELLPTTCRAKTRCPPGRATVVFTGTFVMADYARGHESWALSKSDYNEFGPKIIHRTFI